MHARFIQSAVVIVHASHLSPSCQLYFPCTHFSTKGSLATLIRAQRGELEVHRAVLLLFSRKEAS